MPDCIAIDPSPKSNPAFWKRLMLLCSGMLKKSPTRNIQSDLSFETINRIFGNYRKSYLKFHRTIEMSCSLAELPLLSAICKI